MKYYPCYIISGEELDEAGISEVVFSNGTLKDPSVIEKIEDYCRTPIVSVQPSPRGKDELFAFVADGYIQRNPLNGRRTAVLIGTEETLQCILSDIIDERPDKTPMEVFDSYAYQTEIEVQYALKEWIKKTWPEA